MNEKANAEYEEEKDLYQLVKNLNYELVDRLNDSLVMIEDESGLQLRMNGGKGCNPWNQVPCQTRREMIRLVEGMLDAMFRPEREWENEVESLRSGSQHFHVGDMRIAEEHSMRDFPTQYGLFGIYCDANLMVAECHDGFKSFEEYLDKDFWQIAKIEILDQQYLMMDTDIPHLAYAGRRRIPHTILCRGLTGRNIEEKLHELMIQLDLKEMEPLKHYIGLHIFKF
jgi:hypothetical protein